MNSFYHPSTPLVPGSLHQLSQEHDNCGMGAIALLNGKKSHQVIDFALTSVCSMTHRGAVDADMKTGDGSGVLTQIPFPLFRKAAAVLGHTLENEADLAVGVFFFPNENSKAIDEIKSIVNAVTSKRGISTLGWREVPVDLDALGKLAASTRPHIEHLLMLKPAGCEADHFERQLYLCRREIEKLTKQFNPASTFPRSRAA
jgi:glutamate synthase domain-containing protein 1